MSLTSKRPSRVKVPNFATKEQAVSMNLTLYRLRSGDDGFSKRVIG